MVIAELAEYYDFLYAQGLVLPPEFESVPITHLILLTKDGRVDSIKDWRVRETVTDRKGRERERVTPRMTVLPKRFSKSGMSNIVEHRPDYLFGLRAEKDGSLTAESSNGNLEKHHEACVRKNLEFLEGIHSPVAEAYRNFLLTWVPESETWNENLASISDQMERAYFAFALADDQDALLHEDELIKEKWISYVDSYYPTGGIGQCCITGARGSIPLTHDRLIGVPGAQARSSMICYNNPSELSYGQVQSQNSCVGMGTMKKYVSAFNYLMDGKDHKVVFDDLTILFWSSGGSREEEDIFRQFLSDDGNGREGNDENWDAAFRTALLKAHKWKLGGKERDFLEDRSGKQDFYIVGLKPNGGRVAVVSYKHGTLPDIFDRIDAFESEIQTGETPFMMSLNQVRYAIMSGSKNYDHTLLEEIERSVLEGLPYPEAMAGTLLSLVGKDGKLTRARLGLMKAYLRRNHKEDVPMALDRQKKDKAYLTGRLFAVARKTQEDGARRDINRTLFDKYFKQVRISPEATIPKVRDSYEYYLKKVPNPGRYGREMTEITELMEGEYPSGPQDSRSQVLFLAGFDDQYNNFFKKSEDAV